MKPRGRHPDKALSAIRVRAITEPGRYADGNGLYLVVDPSGAKRWILRTVVRGTRHDIVPRRAAGGLAGRGPGAGAGLPQAGTQRRRSAGGAPQGAAPDPDLRAGGAGGPRRTLGGVEEREALGAVGQHLGPVLFPIIGHRRVDQIETPDVLKVLAPIWLTKPETARRVRQRISVVLDWAKASGFRGGETQSRAWLRDCRGSRSASRITRRYRMPTCPLSSWLCARPTWACGAARLRVPGFDRNPHQRGAGGEVGEIDLDGETWTIPPERTKTARQHRVPLSRRSLEILVDAKELSGDSPYIFPGRSVGKPLSNMVLLMTLRRMGVNVTAHGFRSSFRDWASERTGFTREVCELALGHSVKDKTEAAYRRGDLLDKRRDLMEAWAAFATSTQADVVPMRGRG